jgi:hypothetical protein
MLFSFVLDYVLSHIWRRIDNLCRADIFVKSCHHDCHFSYGPYWMPLTVFAVGPPLIWVQDISSLTQRLGSRINFCTRQLAGRKADPVPKTKPESFFSLFPPCRTVLVPKYNSPFSRMPVLAVGVSFKLVRYARSSALTPFSAWDNVDIVVLS